jgi:hypothetical protein
MFEDSAKGPLHAIGGYIMAKGGLSLGLFSTLPDMMPCRDASAQRSGAELPSLGKNSRRV